ncbi:GNAT family N-acetyltransferase [Psychrobacillus sp. NPDC093180]|uniref:GNAT family N-acetyltransferase n=1 Tax=Psychrobacillus sp. NPDC093180 TaxID=3364489 RepID=UPI0037FD4BA3
MLERQIERIKKSISRAERDTFYSFGIFLTENEQLIGNVTLSEVVQGDLQSCWIGYYLDKGQNGKGYMSEAVRQAVEFEFKELKLHRIEAGVMPHNLGSSELPTT